MGKASDADIVGVLKALGDETRWDICNLLRDTERPVSELVDRLRISQPLVSHHLRVLRRARLVRGRRQGNWIYYSLDKDGFDRLVGRLSSDFGGL